MRFHLIPALLSKIILKRKIAKLPQIRLVLGSSGIHDPGWIPTDIRTLDITQESDWDFYFQERKPTSILAEHVWEHLTPEAALAAARLCYKHLTPGGVLRIAVPDGYHPDREYIDWVKPGGCGPGSDDHKVLYTFSSARKLFESVGFSVALLEYFDESGQFHAQDWNPAEGKIARSKRFDERNADGKLRYTSIILDARKK